jgi:tRNA threonylcarbamoyladenosine biosynthesis protein TsaE
MPNSNLIWENGSNKIISANAKNTFSLGYNFNLKKESVIAFLGDLGSGKTTFIKGILSSLGVEEKKVTSPTFTYLNIHSTKDITAYHFDLYRLKGSVDFISMGFHEYFDKGLCLIEWAERIKDILPKDTIFFSIKHVGHDTREIIISNGQG